MSASPVSVSASPVSVVISCGVCTSVGRLPGITAEESDQAGFSGGIERGSLCRAGTGLGVIEVRAGQLDGVGVREVCESPPAA